jgi:DNA-directed RNA polymerase I, II, and III subunit RPABC1
MQMENKTLFTVIKNNDEKIEIIKKNIIIMLSNRIYIDKEGNKHSLIDKNSKLKDHSNNVFTIKTDNGDNYAIKIIFDKITSVGKKSSINEFLEEYPKHKKIIVASEYINKIEVYMNKHHTQIFPENALLENIIDHHDQPVEFQLLTPAEMEQVKKEYNINDYTLSKYSRHDPIVKYYGLKKGDIVRIIRASPVSGLAIAYRIVL